MRPLFGYFIGVYMLKNKPFVLLTSALFLLASCGSQPSSSASSASSSASQSGLSKSVSSSASASQQSFDPETVENSIIIHYHRDDGEYTKWWLWLWAEGKDGGSYNFTASDSYGGVSVNPISTFFTSAAGAKLGFIVRDADWNKDVGEDRYLELDSLTADEHGNYEVWLYTGVAQVYTEEPTNVSFLSACYFGSFRKVNAVSGKGKIYKLELLQDETSVAVESFEGVTTASLDLNEDIDIAKPYSIKATFENDYEVNQFVSPVNLYDTTAFQDAYHYDGDDLGLTYTSVKSTFKVWSPVAKAISLKIYDTGTPAKLASEAHPGSDTPYKTVEMTKGEKGVWTAEVAEDLAGKYYTYAVTNYLYEAKEVVDPYAKAVGVNGLRGMILDLNTTNPEGWNNVTPHQTDRKALTVWECHIADLSSSSTWGGTPANAKRYAGFHETGTTYTENGVTVKTGFDHVKELGVNAVQILPMFDQDNDETNPTFNWGYNPQNYNAPEGVYSSDPYDGAVRIRELKSLIADYTNAGINIIMDVVYNHVSSVAGQNFDVLMPYYYFRYDASLGLSNGSGCGNETASNHSMFAKFMIDSAAFWAKEYKLGGFRFDLMALHDLDTMANLTAKCKEINPGIVIYGEPWTGGSTPLPAIKQASIANQGKFNGYGCFNDQIRDGLIAGGLAAPTDKAWATYKTGQSAAKWGALQAGIKGQLSRSNDPNKTITYVSCHDNYTLYDRVKAAHGAALSDEEALKMAELAQAVVLTSQGTAFMLAGEEMLRTKGGDHNSYQSSYEVNELNYALKVKYPTLFSDYQSLIQVKRNYGGLHLEQAQAQDIEVKHNDDYSLVWYDLPMVDGATARIAHANGVFGGETGIDFSGYQLYLSTAGEATLSANTVLQPFQTIIAAKTAS